MNPIRRFFQKEPSPPPAPALSRESIAAEFLRGDGIEIGALHMKLETPPGASVRYVDRMPTAELRVHYPELKNAPLIEPDVIDDGEKLEKFEDASQDFIIANHFLEHCEDPIRTFENFLRALKSGGVIFLAIPDKRFSFDRDREVTSVDHLVRDHEKGPEVSRRKHYEEWAFLVDKLSKEKAPHQIEHYMKIRYSIHFHVWTPLAYLEFLVYLQRDRGLPFTTELMLARNEEIVSIFKKF